MSTKEKEKEIKYGEAMEELEAILKRIEEDEVDIDDLAQEVKRAAELIRLCKKKIEKTEMEVNRIVQSFESGLEEDAPIGTRPTHGMSAPDDSR